MRFMVFELPALCNVDGEEGEEISGALRSFAVKSRSWRNLILVERGLLCRIGLRIPASARAGSNADFGLSGRRTWHQKTYQAQSKMRCD